MNSSIKIESKIIEATVEIMPGSGMQVTSDTKSRIRSGHVDPTIFLRSYSDLLCVNLDPTFIFGVVLHILVTSRIAYFRTDRQPMWRFYVSRFPWSLRAFTTKAKNHYAVCEGHKARE
jgi:hypothetical protein